MIQQIQQIQPIEQQIELAVTIAALVLLLSSGAWVLASYRKSRTLWAAMSAAALVFVVRWILAEPTFVHASLHGPRLLEVPYNNPYESFRGYGPLAPLLHGWLLRSWGPDLTHVALFHQLCSSLALVPLAWLAGRLAGSQTAPAGSRMAMLGAFVVAALHPVLVRIGASEDAHVLAVLLAWIGLAAMYDYGHDQQVSRLLLTTAALILMLHTRQIMLVVLPFPFVLAVAQRRSLLRDPWFWAAIIVCSFVLVLRLFVLASNPDQTFHLRSIAARMSSLGIVLAALRHHPLFDVGLYQPLFVPLWVVGLVATWRSSSVGRWFVVCFAAMFVSTLWTYEGRNVALMFRMPLLTCACVLAGVGFQRLLVLAERRFGAQRSRWITGVSAGVIALAPLALPGWRIVDELRPLTREYRMIQAAAPSLPKRFILVVNAGGGIDRPSYQFPTHLLRGAGIEVIERTPQNLLDEQHFDQPHLDQPHSDQPLIFFRGVACYAYSLIELADIPTLDFATIIRTIGETAASHRVPADLLIPAQMRPECAVLLDGARLLGDLVRVPARPHDVPFELYGVQEIEMGFYQVTPEALRAAQNSFTPEGPG